MAQRYGAVPVRPGVSGQGKWAARREALRACLPGVQALRAARYREWSDASASMTGEG